MTFVRGQHKIRSSGRRPGTPNKNTSLKRAGVQSELQICREGGVDPISIMMEAARFLNKVANLRAPEDLAELRMMPRAELEFVAGLLVKASDIASKVANFAYPKVAPVPCVGDSPIGLQPDNRRMVVKLRISADRSPPIQQEVDGH